MPVRLKAECCWLFKLISGQRFSHLHSLFSLADISDKPREHPLAVLGHFSQRDFHRELLPILMEACQQLCLAVRSAEPGPEGRK